MTMQFTVFRNLSYPTRLLFAKYKILTGPCSVSHILKICDTERERVACLLPSPASSLIPCSHTRPPPPLLYKSTEISHNIMGVIPSEDGRPVNPPALLALPCQIPLNAHIKTLGCYRASRRPVKWDH